MRLTFFLPVASLLPTLACGPKVDDPSGDTEGTGTTMAPAGTTDASPTMSGPSTLDAGDETSGSTTDSIPPGPPSTNALDILFVIDNSGSMGEEQATLAAGIGQLVDTLEAAGADLRIGITTTDNGNPWCDGTGPEGGNLVATSCRSHIQDFVFAGATMVDASQEACLDPCPEEWTNIAIENGVPWIESAGGVTNLPAGLGVTQALQCMLPQGINGCGFEQPLESMAKTILRSANETEASFGFMRADSSMAIVVVTDEIDCSFNSDHETIFLPDGNRVFWSNPDNGSPTSAVCWNAGVACTGGPGTYDACNPVDLDVNGNPVAPQAAEDQAVIRPISRYVDRLQALEDEKRQLNPGAEVTLALIAGVANDGTVTYADTQADPQFQSDFGIGPGCQSDAGRAVPPVRLHALASNFAVGDDQAHFSICNDDFGASLSAIAETLTQLLP